MIYSYVNKPMFLNETSMFSNGFEMFINRFFYYNVFKWIQIFLNGLKYIKIVWKAIVSVSDEIILPSVMSESSLN